MARARCKAGWRTTSPDPATIAPTLREFGFVGSKADPVEVRASFDDHGRPRRIHARYADGWTCTVHLSLDKTYSLSQCHRMRVAGGKMSV